MTTNDPEARGVREDAERIWHDFNKQYYEPVELIAYALRREREEREELHGEQIERAFKDGWGAALKRLDSLGAKCKTCGADLNCICPVCEREERE